MPLSNLTPRELDVVGHCLQAVADGKLIKHDDEFQTMFGIEIEEFLAVAAAWPDVDDADETVFLAINNSMRHLLGLIPKSILRKEMQFQPAIIEAVFSKWAKQLPQA